MDIITTFGVRGKIEPKNGPQRNGFFGGLLKKRITPVRELQILSPSGILLYFNMDMDMDMDLWTYLVKVY